MHPALYHKQTANKGFGIFTNQDLQADLLIECSPVIVMSAKERTILDLTTLHDYLFEWQDGCCMAMGYIPVYNHAAPSNCEYIMDYERNVISVVTMETIPAGAELTINYHGDRDNQAAVWFEVK